MQINNTLFHQFHCLIVIYRKTIDLLIIYFLDRKLADHCIPNIILYLFIYIVKIEHRFQEHVSRVSAVIE